MTWIKSASPKKLHDQFGVYHGQWLPEMDRCWIRKEDHTCVSSRLLRTQWGKVEHVTITRRAPDKDPMDVWSGDTDFTWAEKQQIKDELFGKNRTAIEVYPREEDLIDTSNVYHLWVFDKKFEMPFGIHPKQYQKAINRGALPLASTEIQALRDYYDNEEENIT